MKLPVLLLGLLLAAMFWPPMGHSAHHRRGLAGHCPALRRQPVRVLRTPGASGQPKVVKRVR